MPGLLSGSASLKGTSGLTTVFIGLPTAQPNLGVTPTTSTGYTLITKADGQLTWTSTLGTILFKDRVIQSAVTNTDLIIRSVGTGAVRLIGNISYEGNTVTSFLASFTNLVAYNATITNLLVSGKIDFTSATSTATFAGDVIMDQDLRVNEQFDAYGNVGLNPDNGIVYIRPTGVGTVLIRPGSTGQLDNMNIGTIIPAIGSFTDLTAQSLTVTNIASINDLRVNNTSTFNGVVTVNSTVTATTIYGLSIYDNGTRVITNVTAGIGLSGGGTGPGVTLNNTGVLSLTAGTDTAVSTSTGNVVVWNTTTLDSLTSRSNSTTNSIYAGQLYDSGSRVISRIDVGAGLAINTSTGPSVFMTNTGVISLTAGTDTAVSSTSGNVTVWNTSTLQSVTDRGATTDNRIHITSAYTGSGTWTDVALRIDGDVGIGNNLYIKGNFYASGQAVITTATIAGNLNSGTDILITVDTGTGSIRFDNTSTLQTVTGRGSETNHIVYFINTTNSTSTNSGAIQVTGGVGIGQDVHIGGTATVTGSVYSQDGIAAYSYLLYTPRVTVSTSTPVAARIGDFWIDPSIGVEYQYVPNGTQTVWIQFIGF